MNDKMKMYVKLGLVALAVVIVLCLIFGCTYWINDQDWAIRQSISGNVEVQEKPGIHFGLFPKVWKYPRAALAVYNDEEDEGEKRVQSIRVTFNDGGTAQISTMVRFSTPSSKEMRRKFHQDFSGNIENANMAVKAHLINCLKSAAPLMSASEHQSARKSEYSQIVEEQMRNGLYEMRKVEKELKDRTDENGNPILVFATEVIIDDNGKAVIAQISPLQTYEITVLQFSVTGTEYDPQTREQFAAKKTAFLKAEQSKAERESEVQERLMVEQKGEREKAEAEAVANVLKATAVIAAEQKAEVALQAKIEAETKATQLLEVSKIEKEEAQIKLEIAKLDAEAIIELAKAEEQKIELAGAIKEEVRILAEISAQRDIEMAKFLTQIASPANVTIFGGGGGGMAQGGAPMNQKDYLMSLFIMQQMGLMGDDAKPIQATLSDAISKKISVKTNAELKAEADARKNVITADVSKPIKPVKLAVVGGEG